MGEAEFERDGSLVTVVLDGQPQSAVDLDDPERLDFEYVQHLALCIDASPPTVRCGSPTSVGPGSPWPAGCSTGGPGRRRWCWSRTRRSPRPCAASCPCRAGTASGCGRSTGSPGWPRWATRAPTSWSSTRTPRGACRRSCRRSSGSPTSGACWCRVACWSPTSPTSRGCGTPRGSPPVHGWPWGTSPFVGLHEVLKGKRFGNVVLVGLDRPARPLDAAARRGIRRPADRSAVLGGDRAASPGRAPVQRAEDDTAASPEPPERGAWRRR